MVGEVSRFARLPSAQDGVGFNARKRVLVWQSHAKARFVSRVKCRLFGETAD